MANLYACLVFYIGGVIFAHIVPAAKLLLLAPILTVVYFAYILASTSHIGAAVIDSISAFVCIQLGYVSGLALQTAYASFLPKATFPSQYNAIRENESETK